MEVISKEDVLKEMNARVSEVVQYFSEKSKREQAIRDAARFLGISNSQTKCFFYNQSTRIDAHVADQIRVRTDRYLHQLDDVHHASAGKNMRLDHSVLDLNPIHDSDFQAVRQSWSWEELSIEKRGGIAFDILSIFDRSNRRKDDSFKALSHLKIGENISLIDRSLIYRMHDDFNDGFYCYSGRAIGVPAITEQGMTIRESPSTGDADT
jgi:hypothetical protein